MQTLTTVQQEAIKKPCPHCGEGKLHEVEGINDGAENCTPENYLWCNTCLLSMDGGGSYTC